MNFDLSNLAVLVADDSAHMRTLIRDILVELGIRTIYQASDGAEAFEVIRNKIVDVIIIDQHMKPVSGMEFLNWLRKTPDSPDPFIPVIMITGDSTRAMTHAARDAGVSAFIAKPMSAINLIEKFMFILRDNRKFIRAKNYVGPDRRFRVDNGFPMARRSSDAKKRKTRNE